MSELRGFKFVATLVLMFKKIESEDNTKFDTFYSNSKPEVTINESDIDDVFELIDSVIISNIQKSLVEDLGWIIESVINHNISILKYNSLAGGRFIKLLKEFDHPREVLINDQNIDDNECHKWSLVRYLHPTDHNPWKITIADKEFAKKLSFKGIKFSVKIRDIHKIEKKESHRH